MPEGALYLDPPVDVRREDCQSEVTPTTFFVQASEEIFVAGTLLLVRTFFVDDGLEEVECAGLQVWNEELSMEKLKQSVEFDFGDWDAALAADLPDRPEMFFHGRTPQNPSQTTRELIAAYVRRVQLGDKPWEEGVRRSEVHPAY